MFADLCTKAGGERLSYQIPTYEAVKGILHSIYWKPTFIWIVDEVRVMNQIQTESWGVRGSIFDGGTDLFYNTYLRDVRYQIKAHYRWNQNRPEFTSDRIAGKHNAMIRHMIKAGGRRDIFLGSRECQGYIEACKFGEGEGFYDHSGKMLFGNLYHGLTYPDEAVLPEDQGMLTVRFWNCVMDNGIIRYPRPEACTRKRQLRRMEMKKFIQEEKGELAERSE